MSSLYYESIDANLDSYLYIRAFVSMLIRGELVLCALLSRGWMDLCDNMREVRFAYTGVMCRAHLFDCAHVQQCECRDF